MTPATTENSTTRHIPTVRIRRSTQNAHRASADPLPERLIPSAAPQESDPASTPRLMLLVPEVVQIITESSLDVRFCLPSVI
ncbi:hypothetical protein Hypma_002270 [Hypsizygus marmoreus]|uniref:Uncharacterized protein n=1 Tax=Hypsizygus marmoreus TaxID=39966 RepID=A0A369K7W2_HYPMA|nr:hypothetical protein Hypma_002270 [Hypsizygus marmoreus]